MIRLTPYTKLADKAQRDTVLRLYLYMVAASLPFYPEDVFTDGVFYPNGLSPKKTADFPRRARSRTEKYKKVISRYTKPDQISHIKSTKTIDALVAKRIIREYSKTLYNFLYAEEDVLGHVIPEKLRTLLTTFADDEGLYQNGLKDVLTESKVADESVRKDLLEHVFRYDVFSKHPLIHHFVKLLGATVCPYCNRLYITTVECTGNGRAIRPELDHYRDKSHYPFLAVSILNLVPVCSVCNHIKGDRPELLLYPYAEEMGSSCAFRTRPIDGITYLTGARAPIEAFSIGFELSPTIAEEKMEHIKASIEVLQLSSLYNSLKDYVSDLMLQRYIFTDTMISDIYSQFSDLFKDKDDVRNMLFLMDIAEENWGKRPLAKLTHDISEELDELYGIM